jgi:predicted MFS family arabinose efflux permease
MTMAGSRAFIWILAVSGFASTFSGRAVEPMIGVIARDLSARPETVALLAAAFALPYAFIQPILGPIGDAVGKERVMKICLLVLVLALMGSVVAPNAAILFGLRMVAGAAAGGVVPLSLALIGDRVAMAGRQVAISRFLIAIITGQLAGSSLAGLLAAFVGWRGVFVASTAMLTVAFVATVGGFRKAPSAGGFDPRDALARYARIIANPRARTLFLLVFVEAITVFGLFPYVAPLLEERGEGGPAEAGLVLAGFAIGGLVYSALVGWMLRRLGLRRMLRGGGMIAGSALLILGVAVDWRLDLLALLGLGLGFYVLHNSFQTQVTELAPEARASAVALHAFSFFVGQSLGVVLVGLGLRGAGLFGTMSLCALGILGVGVVGALALTQPTQRAR